METASPQIENTGDVLRIEFPGTQHRAGGVVLALLLPALWYPVMKMFGGLETRDVWATWLVPFALWMVLIWQTFRRYTIVVSEKGLAIRQQAFGIRRTKFYPLAEIRNLHVRYNPVLGKPPKQWELMFDRYALPHSVPIPMTLPDAQSVKAAIYSHFPQLM